MLQKFGLITIAILMFIRFSLGNPVIVNNINEFGFTSEDSTWKIELAGSLPDSLDDIYLESSNNTVYLKEGIQVSSDSVEYIVITNDSLKSDIEINPDEDIVKIDSDSSGVRGEIRYGGSSFPPAPEPGQSLCLYNEGQGGIYYMDNTPTFGSSNDTTGAKGKISIQVKDSTSEEPLGNINVWEEHLGNYWAWYQVDSIGGTNDNGEIDMQLVSGYHMFRFSKADTLDWKRDIVIKGVVYPDSVTNITVKMDTTTTGIETSNSPDMSYKLSKNYPNPFNSSTTFYYELPINDHVEISLFDVRGRLIKNISSGYKQSGRHKVKVNFSDLSSGVYFYRLQTANQTITRKCMYVK